MAEIEMLGATLAEDGHEIIYGGSRNGCMGALARGVQTKGGHLTGVIPELAVSDLSSRKVTMNGLADAFIIFPGGLGTLDEAFEVLALKSAGSLDKPIIFYNFMDVWTPLIEALKLLEEQRLIRTPLDELLVVLDKPSEVRESLR